VTASRDGPTLTHVGTAWNDAERVALVALLRSRPHGLTWPQITAEVDRRASASALWDELHPPTLLDGDAEAPELAEARADIEAWRTASRLGSTPLPMSPRWRLAGAPSQYSAPG